MITDELAFHNIVNDSSLYTYTAVMTTVVLSLMLVSDNYIPQRREPNIHIASLSTEHSQLWDLGYGTVFCRIWEWRTYRTM